jgi:hypothetical protein
MLKKTQQPTEAVQILVVTSDSTNIQMEVDVSIWKHKDCLSKKLLAVFDRQEIDR